jgi:CRP-like cAMP-binding protein
MWRSSTQADRDGDSARGFDIAATPKPAAEARRKSAYEIAVTIANGLEGSRRVVLLKALTVLGPSSATERIRAWLQTHPNEEATHAEIADAVGLTRPTVTRAINRERRRRQRERGEKP